MKFRVKWESIINGEKRAGVESEASWFLVDQQGKMYSHGPMRPVQPINHEIYTECIPLFQVGEEWLPFEEIERRLKAGENE